MRKLLSSFLCFVMLAGMACANGLKPVPSLANRVADGSLPVIAERVPSAPMVVDLAAKGREIGEYGGVLRTMVARKKDIRQMVVYGYARLVGYDHNYELKADLLKSFENEGNRRITFHLREGHRWSDGHPFTSEDFRYYWEDTVGNAELSPGGVPSFLLANGKPPVVSFPDALTVIYEWEDPHPTFLTELGQARPPFIYRPAHHLKKYHIKYGNAEKLAKKAEEKGVSSWAALHNKKDNMYKFKDASLPTLQPWLNTGEKSSSRMIFERNPFFHRIDTAGHQLPYIDRVEMQIAASGVLPAKTNAGEADLQSRSLSFDDISILKRGEAEGNYSTQLWPNGNASHIAIYPNLNYTDPEFRELFRDVRFRRALSLAIDRRIINRSLYFGLAREVGMSVLPDSPLHKPENDAAWAAFDIETADALLDEIGLKEVRGDGIRLLPSGRPLTIVVQTAGERREVEDSLQLVAETWAEIGVELIMRPLDRDNLRNQVYSGHSMMAVWFGWDNGLPNPDTSPAYLAPRFQEFFAWPKWGQNYQTKGESGEAPDLPEAQELMELSLGWDRTSDTGERTVIWERMLAIHADQVYGIGIVNAAPQPVVVSNDLLNMPDGGIWCWEPGAHFGVHRIDEFFFTPERRKAVEG